MELYTLDRDFYKQDIIDRFSSCIWTERYYGNSEVELVVPATLEMTNKLPEGIFLGLNGSDEIMILETTENEDDKLKIKGISLLSWLNNRFVRTSPVHADKYWFIKEQGPGYILWSIVYNMCCEGSPYLSGAFPTGIPNSEELAIPGLGLKEYYEDGTDVSVAVPYGPVYDALREIAVTYEIGMKISLESDRSLAFLSYKGLDRTSNQNLTEAHNSIVRFSPDMDSLTGIKELRSIGALKTRVYAFAPGLTDPMPTDPGVSILSETAYTGFDLRALMVFADDITTDMIGGDGGDLLDILNNRALTSLTTNSFIKTVDGEIIPTSQYQYGVHYNLGDLIEVQGNSEIIQVSRVTEYIRSQDENGETAYPTLETID